MEKRSNEAEKIELCALELLQLCKMAKHASNF
jgi:hypothetical protein